MTLEQLKVPGLDRLDPAWIQEEERQRAEQEGLQAELARRGTIAPAPVPAPAAQTVNRGAARLTGTIAPRLAPALPSSGSASTPPAPAAQAPAAPSFTSSAEAAPSNPRFSTGNAWVDSLRPTAEKYGQQLGGIPPEILIAMNASESNWGAAPTLFGIKGKSPSGKSQSFATWESVNGQRVDTNDEFAVYDSPDEAYQHFINFLNDNPRYADAVKKAKAGDYEGFVRGLNAAGYATDPKWADLILGIASDISGGRVPRSDARALGATSTAEAEKVNRRGTMARLSVAARIRAAEDQKPEQSRGLFGSIKRAAGDVAKAATVDIPNAVASVASNPVTRGVADVVGPVVVGGPINGPLALAGKIARSVSLESAAPASLDQQAPEQRQAPPIAANETQVDPAIDPDEQRRAVVNEFVSQFATDAEKRDLIDEYHQAIEDGLTPDAAIQAMVEFSKQFTSGRINRGLGGGQDVNLKNPLGILDAAGQPFQIAGEAAATAGDRASVAATGSPLPEPVRRGIEIAPGFVAGPSSLPGTIAKRAAILATTVGAGELTDVAGLGQGTGELVASLGAPAGLAALEGGTNAIKRIRAANIVGESDNTILDSVRQKFLTAAQQEANMRRTGAVAREIRQGRAAQAEGIRGVIARPGQTPEEIAAAAREAASQGGTLRRSTLLQPIKLSPEETQAVFDEIGRQVSAGELGEFDYLRMVMPAESSNPGIIAKLQSDTPRLQPAEVKLLRQVFGDEFAQAVAERSANSIEPRMTPAQERAEMLRADRIEQQQIEKAQRDAVKAEQLYNRQVARAQEKVDARDIKAIEDAKAKALRDFNRADEMEVRQARRWSEDSMAKQETALRRQEAAANRNDAAAMQNIDRFKPSADAGGVERFAADRLKTDADLAAETNRMNTDAEAKQLQSQARPDIKARNSEAQATYQKDYAQLNDAEKLDVAKRTNQPEAVINDLERRVQEKWDTQNPNEEMMRRRLSEAAATIGAGDEVNQTAIDAILYATKKARATLDRFNEPNQFQRLIGAVRAGLTGDTPNAYVTTLLRQTENLQTAMRELGADPRLARQLANTWRDAELKARYPQGVPASVTSALDSAKAIEYGKSWGGLEDFVQKYKNLMFSTDAGIIGVQVQAAVDRGGVQGLVGLANRMAAQWQLPHAEIYSTDVNLPKRLRNILDGVHEGIGPSAIQPEANAQGKAGKLLETLTDFQFRTVLGNVRQVEYEGNLTLLHLLGRDINDPRVRAVAADYANNATSFSPSSLRKGRATAEKLLLTSPSMTRADIGNLLQASKLIRPDAMAEERILAAALIASRLTTLIVKGTVMNALIGTGDPIEWDPRKPGFAQVTTRITNARGQNQVLSLVPQSSLQRAFVKSIDALSQGDAEAAAWAPAQAVTGRSSIVGNVLLGALGVGYDKEGRFHRGDLPAGINETANRLAPIPPIAQSQLGQNRGLATLALDFIGESGFPESAASVRDRAAAQGNFTDAAGNKLTTFNELLPSQQKQVDAIPEVARALDMRPQTEYQKAKEIAYQPIVSQQNLVEQSFQDGTLSKPITDWWHDLSQQKQGAQAALKASFRKQLSKYDQDQFDKAVEGYYAAEVTFEDGGTDWEATDQARRQFLDSLPENQRTWLEDFLDVQAENQSPLRQQYFGYLDAKEAAGYFREGITGSERSALDRANPEIDVQGWYFGGGLKDGKGTPTLQSKAAVDQALAMNLPNRPVKLAGLDRAINENEGTRAAWERMGSSIDRFVSGRYVEFFSDQVARQRYQKPFAELNDNQQSSVASYIQTEIRKSSPELDAWLAWFGKYSVIQTFAAGAALQQIRATYGREPVGNDGPIRYADNAR